MIGELLRNPNAARVRFVEQGFAANGHPAIRQPHLSIFEYIDHDQGSRITDLAGHANISVQAMGELVAHLSTHGYVERVPDPDDGRAKRVRLTARGWEVYELARDLINELERVWAGYLGVDQFRELKRLLAHLCDAIEHGQATATDS